MNKIKSILFGILEKALNFFGSLGINKKTPGAFRIYNFLFKHSWPYGDIIEIQGSKMYVNIRDEPSYSIRKTFEFYASNRIHEKATTELFKKTVKEGNVVIDLGANIGYFSLLAARFVGKNGKVYSFEPEPKNYSYLIKNIKLNNYDNVIAIQKAVSNKIGKTKLYICSYDAGHHTINQIEGIKAYRPEAIINEKDFVEIETVTLDEFFKDKEDLIDVIKIDVEGAEVLTLAGMDRILKVNKKLKMFIEFFPLLIREMGNSPEEFIRKLSENYGFSIFIIPDDYDAKEGEMVKINSAEELMGLCKDEKTHVNLFLKRT
jgi:FkbM family methyltransferase